MSRFIYSTISRELRFLALHTFDTSKFAWIIIQCIMIDININIKIVYLR